MMTLVVVLCEVIGASVALTALGKLSTPWTNSVTADTVDVWINATWFDCCFFPNDTARVTYDCWTAQHSSFVSNATCANEKAFYDEFTGW